MNAFNTYRVAILKLACGTYLAGLAVYQSNNSQWTTMGTDERISLLLGISGAMVAFVIGFFDRTLSRIDAEQKQKTETKT